MKKVVTDLRNPRGCYQTVETVFLELNVRYTTIQRICFGRNEKDVVLGRQDFRTGGRFKEFTRGTLLANLKDGYEWGYTGKPANHVTDGILICYTGGRGIPEEILEIVLAATPAYLPNLPIIDLPPDPDVIFARLRAQMGGSLFGRGR